MPRKSLAYLLSTILILTLVLATSASAAATTKSLSTNFTLVNLGSSPANVSVDYVKPDGTLWMGSSYTSAIIPADGGQWIVRQYFDTLSPGQGSVVISSDQPLGALVQIINRNGVPTSGAYKGFSVGTAKAYVPLVARQGTSATGIANSQIMIQNIGSSAIDVQVALTRVGNTTPDYTKTIRGIASKATFTYDISDETNLPTNWWGSAEVSVTTAGGQVAVVSNLFFGADSLMTFGGFPQESVDSVWFIPLLYSRLANSLNTSLAIQNLDTTDIAAGDMVLKCTKDPAYPGPNTLTISNTKAIPVKGSYTFNTLIDTTNFPTNWQGSCKISVTSGKKVVALVMYRWVNTKDQAAYEAIPGSSRGTTAYIPLVAKRLSNGFSTTITIQNLSTNPATVTLTYTPSSGGTPIVRTGITIPAESSIVRNFRLSATELPEITDGWQGSLKIVSNQPVHAYIANTYITPPNGDQFMAYTALVP